MLPTRRKFLQLIGMESLSFLAAKKKNIPVSESEDSVIFVRNETLPTILDGYKGNPTIDGRFVNSDLGASEQSFDKVSKWFISTNPQKEEKEKEEYSIPVRMLPEQVTIKEDCIIWMGHASFLIHLDGKWLLTDPCLTSPLFRRRYTQLPIPIDRLKVDYLLISHGHYDHLDSTTLSELPSAEMTALVPLKMADLITSMNKYVRIHEAGWYQQFSLHESFRIFFLPAKHWYIRVPWDRNKILWGSFMIEYKGKHLFFAGDTAYAEHFADIAALFPSIDYCCMPIAAYKPEYVMKLNHTDPEDAVKAFHDLRAKTLLPMHYGTFDLSDEPRGEPIRWLKQIETEGKINGDLRTPVVGEVVYI